jgi:hypothetical protein
MKNTGKKRIKSKSVVVASSLSIHSTKLRLIG